MLKILVNILINLKTLKNNVNENDLKNIFVHIILMRFIILIIKKKK